MTDPELVIPEDLQGPVLPYTSYMADLAPARLPGDRLNLAKDPSAKFGTDPARWTWSGVTPTEDVDTRWVGDQAVKLTVTTASHNTRYGTPTTVDNARRIVVSAGKEYSAGWRMLAGQTDRAGRLVLEFRNSASASLGVARGAVKIITTSGWTLLRVDGANAPANTAFVTAFVEWMDPSSSGYGTLGETPLTVGDVFWLDGLDFHEGPLLDEVYVDGEQPACAWTGTAHDSTSRRTVPEGRELRASESVPYARFYRGFGGSFRVKARVFKADRSGRLIEDISEAFSEGEVTADQDNEGSYWSFTGTFTDPIDLSAEVDCVAPFLRLEYANGKIIDDGSGYGVQMGLYHVLNPEKEITPSNTDYTMNGVDLVWLLDRWRYAGIETEAAGVNLISRVIARLNAAGFTRHSIQSSARTSGKKRTSEVSPSVREVVDEMLHAITWYPITPDRTGQLVSFKSQDLYQRSINAYFLGGEDGAVLEPYGVRPGADVYNHVVVHKDDKDNPLRYSVENNDPTHPLRISRIGRRSMKPVNFSEAESQADVEEEARRLLQEYSSVELTTTLRTFPQPWHNLREVYYLDLKRKDGSRIPEAWGRFLCTGFRIKFTQEDAEMEHSLRKTVAFATSVS